jgi:hypothetical protein
MLSQTLATKKFNPVLEKYLHFVRYDDRLDNTQSKGRVKNQTLDIEAGIHIV